MTSENKDKRTLALIFSTLHDGIDTKTSQKMILPNHFLFFLVFLSICYSPKPVCGNTELKALMEIKISLDPENKYLSSWTTDGDPCGRTFVGVACNEHNKVANISLQSKGLTGKVPPAISELKCLSGLYLHYNSLSGEIPVEIANLTELTDLYLNVNNLTGTIPPQLGTMASLQVLELSDNRLTGDIPIQIGLMKQLSVIALEYNNLSGQIPLNLGNLGMLKVLYLSFNRLSGPIPEILASLPLLEVLDVQNNTLSGFVPPSLKKLNESFNFSNNPGLCGNGFSSFRVCTVWDNLNTNQIQIEPSIPNPNKTGSANPEPAHVPIHGNQIHSSSSSKLPRIAIVTGITTLTVTFLTAGFLCIFRYRRRKQRISNTSEISGDRLSTSQMKESNRSTPPLLSLQRVQTNKDRNCNSICPVIQQGSKFNLEEIESATSHFSEINLLGKSNVSSIYKGILKDGTSVVIKSINIRSCKSEEVEFMNGLSLLTSLKHENLVSLRGFCCSKGRGECFLIYDFASKGNLSLYLDLEDNNINYLDWPSRITIIKGIAKGVQYLHSSDINKPSTVHQNLCADKVLIDEAFNPLISDCGLLQLLADDVVYSAVKVSAAFGYMAPEYITTGRFTEKSDVYAFGVIILQVLSGRKKLTNSMLLVAESSRFEDFIDPNMKGKYSEDQATKLTRLALDCTNEDPDSRPLMSSVIEELMMF